MYCILMLVYFEGKGSYYWVMMSDYLVDGLVCFRMIETGKEFKESLPDDESFALVIGMLLSVDHVDAALKYIDLNLKSGYALSADVFEVCVRGCINHDRLDALVAIIERCKVYLLYLI